jgi:hypothetical protein
MNPYTGRTRGDLGVWPDPAIGPIKIDACKHNAQADDMRLRRLPARLTGRHKIRWKHDWAHWLNTGRMGGE